MNLLKSNQSTSVRIGPFIPTTSADTIKTTISIPANSIRFIKNDGTVVTYAPVITTISNGYVTVPIADTILSVLGQFSVMCVVTGCFVVKHEWLVVSDNMFTLFYENNLPALSFGEFTAEGMTIKDHLDIDGELNIHNPNGGAVHISGRKGIHIESWEEEAVLIESYHNQPDRDASTNGTGFINDFVYTGTPSSVVTSANFMSNFVWDGDVSSWISGATTYIYNTHNYDSNTIGIRTVAMPFGTSKKIVIEAKAAYSTDGIIEFIKYPETSLNEFVVYTGNADSGTSNDIDSATVCIRSMNPTDNATHPAIVFQSNSRNNNAVVCDGGADAHDIVARELDWLNQEIDSGITAGYALKLGAAMAAGKFTYDTNGTMTLFDRYGDIIEVLHVTANGRNR